MLLGSGKLTTMRLGTVLLRNGLINLDQLEKALQTQILHGSRLGTNLVQLGIVSLEDLEEALSMAKGFPVAHPEELADASQERAETLGREIAERFSVCPLADDPSDPECFRIAAMDPGDQDIRKAVEERLGQNLKWHIASEMRVAEQLQRLYGIESSYVAPPQKEKEEDSQARSRRGTMPLSAAPKDSGPESQSRNRRGTLPLASATGSDAGGFIEKKAAGPTLVGRVPMQTCLDALSIASSEDEIGAAIIYYSVGRYRSALLFRVEEEEAHPWLCQIEGQQADNRNQNTLSLQRGSRLKECIETKAPSIGAPGEVDAELAEAWSYALPTEVEVWPIAVSSDGSSLCLLYLIDCVQAQTQAQYRAELGAICQGAAQSLTRLAEG